MLDDRTTGAKVELPVTSLAAGLVEAKHLTVAPSLPPGASQELGAVNGGGSHQSPRRLRLAAMRTCSQGCRDDGFVWPAVPPERCG